MSTETERQEFEAWAKNLSHHTHSEANIAWQAWQAAKASEAGSEPAAWCFTDVNGRPTEFCEPPGQAHENDSRLRTPVYAHPAASVSAQQAEAEPVDEVGCYDCGLKYGGDSWIEAVVPDKVWARIRPDGCSEIGGILCISCIAKRLRGLGSPEVPVYLCGTEPLKAMPMDPSDDLETLRSWDIGDTPHAPAPVVPDEKQIELLAEHVHNAWWAEKDRQGKAESHPDAIPYAELSESVKEYDRTTVKAVLRAMKKEGMH